MPRYIWLAPSYKSTTRGSHQQSEMYIHKLFNQLGFSIVLNTKLSFFQIKKKKKTNKKASFFLAQN